MSDKLEQAFTDALTKAMDEADGLGVVQKRLRADVERFGGAACARELLKKQRRSDGFEALSDLGRLDLSLEALVTAGKFGSLFTDDEVNQCFTALCDNNYYKI